MRNDLNSGAFFTRRVFFILHVICFRIFIINSFPSFHPFFNIVFNAFKICSPYLRRNLSKLHTGWESYDGRSRKGVYVNNVDGKKGKLDFNVN